jgi:predicted RNA-binding Zn ribbon-like protein
MIFRPETAGAGKGSKADAATPPFVADDLALDFVNSVFGIDAERRECLNSGAQVLDWLRHAGLPADPGATLTAAGGEALLRAALALRETARALLEKRKAGAGGDPAALNRVLALGNACWELVWKKGQPPRCELRRRGGRVEALLVPVAEAVARLLAEGDLALVRKCESPDCTLWFHDRTKSHHRRWCSMAMCGNRMKVAAFRARQKRGSRGAE